MSPPRLCVYVTNAKLLYNSKFSILFIISFLINNGNTTEQNKEIVSNTISHSHNHIKGNQCFLKSITRHILRYLNIYYRTNEIMWVKVSNIKPIELISCGCFLASPLFFDTISLIYFLGAVFCLEADDGSLKGICT